MTDKRRPTPIKTFSGRSSSTFSSTSSPPSPSNAMTLTQQFADIIRRYKYYCQHIQRMLKDTDRSYNDINDTRVLTAGMKTTVLFNKKKKHFIYFLEQMTQM